MTEESLSDIVETVTSKTQNMPTTLALISPSGEILYKQEIGEAEEQSREMRKAPNIDEVLITEISEKPANLLDSGEWRAPQMIQSREAEEEVLDDTPVEEVQDEQKMQEVHVNHQVQEVLGDREVQEVLEGQDVQEVLEDNQVQEVLEFHVIHEVTEDELEQVHETPNNTEIQNETQEMFAVPEIVDIAAPENNNELTTRSDSVLSASPDSPVVEHTDVDYLPYYVDKHNLRTVLVKLERCDKIWETLKLIKYAADPVESIPMEDTQDEDSLSSPLPKKRVINPPKRDGDYVQYQPVLGNDNTSLPNFRFSVKSKKKLYHCVTCGREFAENRTLRRHCYREHGIVIPLQRVPKNPAPFPPLFNPLKTKIKQEIQTTDETLSVSDSKNVRQKPSNKLKVYYHSQGSKMKHKFMNSHQSAKKSTGHKKPKILQNLLSGVPVKLKDDSSKKSEKNDQHKKNEKVHIQTKINDHFPKKNDKNIQYSKGEQKVVSPAKDNILLAEKPTNSALNPYVLCVLCKRRSRHIKTHLKEFHKVGCFGSILPQCIPVSMPENPEDSDSKETVENAPVENAPVEKMDTDDHAHPMRKRKRKFTRLTLPSRKRHKVNYILYEKKEGPFTCKICLGIYKTHGTFRKHSIAHMRKGETIHNFDPTNCKYKNSPLRKSLNEVPNQQLKTILDNDSAVTDSTVLDSTSEKKDPLLDEQDDDMTEPVCECGRVFRNPHTLFLHKVKCKHGVDNENMAVTRSSSDRDSGIGISIKIKKKNDSYEVVPKDNERGKFKKAMASKDSDVSSNDSGMASVDFNNDQQISSFAPSKYSKEHSVLRIQVAEDDEDVDIEVDESEQSSFIGSNNTTPAASPVPSLDPNDPSKNKIRRPVGRPRKHRLSIPDVHYRPAFIEKKVYTCQKCDMQFESNYLLNEHVAMLKHEMKVRCICGKRFKFLKGLNSHILNVHPMLLKCAYCQSSFNTYEDCTAHKCEVTEGSKSFVNPPHQTTCLQCNVQIEMGNKFDEHMKTHGHDTNLPYQCFKCTLVFSTQSHRRAHFSKTHSVSFCRFCGQPLHVDVLPRHEAYHEGLGFPCHTCKNVYSSKRSIDKHKRNLHSPSASVLMTCTVCSKSVKRKSFRKHMSSHLHQEICTKCNKCYEDGDERCLESHVVKRHPEDYPHVQCELCEQFFISDEHYQMHLLNDDCKKKNNEKNITEKEKIEQPQILCA